MPLAKNISSVRMRIIRILTTHEKLTPYGIAELSGRPVSQIKAILDEYEESGYVCRLDHGMYSATR